MSRTRQRRTPVHGGEQTQQQGRRAPRAKARPSLLSLRSLFSHPQPASLNTRLLAVVSTVPHWLSAMKQLAV